jgi:hypothetical protein
MGFGRPIHHSNGWFIGRRQQEVLHTPTGCGMSGCGSQKDIALVSKITRELTPSFPIYF